MSINERNNVAYLKESLKTIWFSIYPNNINNANSFCNPIFCYRYAIQTCDFGNEVVWSSGKNVACGCIARSGIREENTTLQALCGKALALSSMANVSKSLKSAVTDNKLKMLISLNQNGNVDWQRRFDTRLAQIINLPAQWRSLTYSVNRMRQRKPVVLFCWKESNLRKLPMEQQVEEVGKSKC